MSICQNLRRYSSRKPWGERFAGVFTLLLGIKQRKEHLGKTTKPKLSSRVLHCWPILKQQLFSYGSFEISLLADETKNTKYDACNLVLPWLSPTVRHSQFLVLLQEIASRCLQPKHRPIQDATDYAVKMID